METFCEMELIFFHLEKYFSDHDLCTGFISDVSVKIISTWFPAAIFVLGVY